MSPRPHPLGHRSRYGGLAGILGGVAWAIWVVLGERRPPCCPHGVENEFLPYEWWKLAAYALVGVAAATLATGAAGRLSSGSRAGAGLVAAGGGLGTASLALEAAGLVLDRPFPEIAALVFLIPAGTVLLGASALTRGELPRSVAAGLLLGGVAFYAGNSETETMLLWSLLGIAWALCGLFVCLERQRRPLGALE